MTTHDVLRKARAYLLEHGWAQTTFQAADGSVCIHGALNLCGAGAVDGCEAKLALTQVLGGGSDIYGSNGPMAWNDKPGRTFDEVIAAFDAAIEATAPPKPDESPFTALADLPAEQYVDALSALALIPAEALK